MKNMITIPEAARIANVSRQAVYLWCRLDGIGEKIGRDWLVDRVKLAQKMEQRAK
jgi:hypothetical protein